MSFRKHIPPLDGLRGIAILLVLTAHLYSPASTKLSQLARTGWVGVDLFFTLSGFLITTILLEAKGRPDYFGSFYMRRARRIFPVYYLALIIGLFVLTDSPGARVLREQQVWFWTYTMNIVKGLPEGGGLPSGWALFWSLAVEEQFYLVWPAVIWLCSADTRRRLLIVLIVAAWGFRPLFLWLGFSPDFVYAQTFTRMDTLCVGALIATYRFEGGHLERFVRSGWRLGGLAGALLGSLYVWRTQLLPIDPYVLVLGMPLVTMICAAVLVLALTGRLRWLAHRSLTFWAPYSYGIYVWHRMATGLIHSEQWFARTHLGTLLSFIASIGVSLAAGMVSWHAFERWFLIRRTRQWAHTAAPAAAALPENS